MNAGIATISRTRVLQALGVTPLRLRATSAQAPMPIVESLAQSPQLASIAATMAPETPLPKLDKRIALARAQAEIEQPALAALYTKITEAISALGLQCVRLSDAEGDPRVRVLAFGNFPLPASIETARVRRVDALSTLDADRARKRALWELMQQLARESGGA